MQWWHLAGWPWHLHLGLNFSPLRELTTYYKAMYNGNLKKTLVELFNCSVIYV